MSQIRRAAEPDQPDQPCGASVAQTVAAVRLSGMAPHSRRAGERAASPIVAAWLWGQATQGNDSLYLHGGRCSALEISESVRVVSELLGGESGQSRSHVRAWTRRLRMSLTCQVILG